MSSRFDSLKYKGITVLSALDDLTRGRRLGQSGGGSGYGVQRAKPTELSEITPFLGRVFIRDVGGITRVTSEINQDLWLDEGDTIGFMFGGKQTSPLVSGLAIYARAKNSSYEPYMILRAEDETETEILNIELEGGLDSGGTRSAIRIQSKLVDEDSVTHQGRIMPRMVHSPAFSDELAWVLALWPLSGNPNDIVANSGMHLTESGVSKSSYEEVAYYDFDGTNDSMYRVDEARISLTGNMSAFGWAFFDDALGASETIFGKWLTTGNLRSFLVERHTTGHIRFRVSSAGTAASTTSVANTNAAAIPAQSEWFFWCVVYVAGTSMTVYVGRAGAPLISITETASIPASIHDNASRLELGAIDTGLANFMDGRQARVGMCNGALDARAVKRLYIQSLELFGFT